MSQAQHIETLRKLLRRCYPFVKASADAAVDPRSKARILADHLERTGIVAPRRKSKRASGR